MNISLESLYSNENTKIEELFYFLSDYAHDKKKIDIFYGGNNILTIFYHLDFLHIKTEIENVFNILKKKFSYVLVKFSSNTFIYSGPQTLDFLEKIFRRFVNNSKKEYRNLLFNQRLPYLLLTEYSNISLDHEEYNITRYIFNDTIVHEVCSYF
jgi:hypothetical protein